MNHEHGESWEFTGRARFDGTDLALDTSREDKKAVFIDSTLPLITILLAWMLIWWWPEIRVALRLPRSSPKIATDIPVGLAQIALPPDWKQTNSLVSNAALQAVDRFRGRYLIVISEPLNDFETHVGLLEYSHLVMSNRLLKQDVTRVTGPIERTVASRQAMQYEYSARVRGMHITYLVTIVQGERAFHQVDCWSLSSTFNRRAFENVVDGFDEQPGPIPERPVGPAERHPPEPTSSYTVH